MTKFLLAILAMIVFAPAGLLWLVAELLYVAVCLFKLVGSISATLALAVSATFDSDIRLLVFNNYILGTTKYAIREDITEQMRHLRQSSVFFERKH